MNTTDMYTREKAARERQADIERHIQTAAMLREADKGRPRAAPKLLLAAGGAVLAIVLAGLLLAAIAYAGAGLPVPL